MILPRHIGATYNLVIALYYNIIYIMYHNTIILSGSWKRDKINNRSF